MKCSWIVIIGCLSLVGVISPNVIPAQIIFEPDDVNEMSSKNDTLVFAHVVS